MKPDIIHSADGDLLRINGPDLPDDSDFEWKIFIRNRIPGLLRCACRTVDGRTEYLYDVTSLVCMEDADPATLFSCSGIKQFFSCMLNTVSSMEDHMLDAGRLILSPGCIFTDPASGSVNFCFSPAPGSGDNMKELAAYFLEHVSLNDPEASSLVLKLYRKIAEGTPAVSAIRNTISFREFSIEKAPEPDMLYHYMDSEEEGSFTQDDTAFLSSSAAHAPDVSRGRVAINKKALFPAVTALAALLISFAVFYFIIPDLMYIFPYEAAVVLLIAAAVYAAARFKGKFRFINDPADDPSLFPMPEDAPGTDIYDDPDDQGTVLIPDQTGHARLIPDTGTFPAGILGIRSFTIGKHKDLCDLVINDPAVSRLHARITYEGGIYFIRDLKSSNGTFVNDEPVSEDLGIPLKKGDVIRFADVVYAFDTQDKST